MDVLVVNTRGGGPEPHWSAERAREVVDALAADGARVRWFCALPPGCAAPPSHPGRELHVVHPPVASFRKVAARVEGPAIEIAVARSLRVRPADHAVVLGAGAPGSCLVSWVADRMGSEVTVGVRAREVLCHRQDLISEDPEGPRGPCETWSDPQRCVRCCRQLQGPVGRTLAASASWLGGISPFPNPLGFANRLENVISGLLPAGHVLVAEEHEREQLAAAGLGARRIEAVAEDAWAARIAERLRGPAPAGGEAVGQG